MRIVGEIPRSTATAQWFCLIREAAEVNGCKARQVQEAFDWIGETVSLDTAKDHLSRAVPHNLDRFHALLRAVQLPTNDIEAAKRIWITIRSGRSELPEVSTLCNDNTLERWIRRLETDWEFGDVDAALEVAKYLADHAPATSVHRVNATRYCAELLALNGRHSEATSMLNRFATLAERWGPQERAESRWLLAIHSPRLGKANKMQLFAHAESIAKSQTEAVWARRLMQSIPRDRLGVVLRGESKTEMIEQADAELRTALNIADTAQSIALGHEMLARASLKLRKLDDAFDHIRKTHEFDGEHSLLFRVKRMITEAKILSASGSNGDALLQAAEDMAIQSGFRLYARQIYKLRNAFSNWESDQGEP